MPCTHFGRCRSARSGPVRNNSCTSLRTPRSGIPAVRVDNRMYTHTHSHMTYLHKNSPRPNRPNRRSNTKKTPEHPSPWMERVRVQAGRRSVRGGGGGGGDGGTVIENPRSARSLACFSCSPVPWEARDNVLRVRVRNKLAISTKLLYSTRAPITRRARTRTYARTLGRTVKRTRAAKRALLCLDVRRIYIYIYIYRSRSRPANTKTGMAHPTGRATTTTTTTSDRDSRSRALIDARAPDGGTRTTRRCTDCTRFRRR